MYSPGVEAREMRVAVLAAVLVLSLIGPQGAQAQVYRHETPPPAVTAASASWQAAGEPIFHAGNVYYPAGATVFFDGRIMVRTGAYEGVPLYADVTLEPFSIVYVPIGGALMRPYERRRNGELAGTVGSRTPSFPIERDAEAAASADDFSVLYPRIAGLMPASRPRVAPAQREGNGTQRARVEETFEAAGAVMIAPRAMAPGRITYGNGMLEPANAANGLWIAFQDARWFSAGTAVVFDAARFEAAGSYNGFPVYRERGGAANRIYVTTVKNGPVAPFERR